MDSKNIICLEPWGGHDISDRGTGGTGLGNRLIHWASIYYISTLYKDRKIILEKKYWSELEFLHLPNTIVQNVDSSYVKNNVSRLSIEDIKDIIYEKKLNIIDNNVFSYYADEFVFLDNRVLINGISKVKFKNERVNKFFEDTFSDFCSIHLRRGSGTIPTVGYIKDFLSYKTKDELKKYLNEYYFSVGYHPPQQYIIVPDSMIFPIVDEIISKNKLQKFYISSDISETYYSYYFDKYPNNIVKREQYFQKFLEIIDYHQDMDELYTYLGMYKCSLKQTLIDLFDIFALSHSKTLVVDNYSTWSMTASLICKKKNKIDAILDTFNRESTSYLEFVKKYCYYPSNSIREKNDKIITGMSTS